MEEHIEETVPIEQIAKQANSSAFHFHGADKRNNIPRKSLNYRTPLEAFMSHLNGVDL
ncbi:integrase, partial [Planococcus antarcticus DSM 14505]